MEGNNLPDVGDSVKLNYNGPGYDPVFEVVDVEDEYMVTLSNGATVYPRDFESGRMEVAN